MSNLGGYQTMTTVVKALGGPTKAFVTAAAVLGVAGYGVIRAGEAGGKKIVAVSKEAIAKRRTSSKAAGQIFRIHTSGVDEKGVEFELGAEYRVLERDGDAILIDLMGDNNSPYFVSGVFLATISSFQPESPIDED